MNRIRVASAVAAVLAIGLVFSVSQGGVRFRKSDVPKALQKLKTGTPKEKAQAAELLGQIGSIRFQWAKDAVQPLRNALLKEADPAVRAAAAEALGKIGAEPQKTAQMLLEVLRKDKADEVKIAAMRGLARIPREGRIAMNEIRKIARNKDKKKRRLTRTAREVMKILRGS